MMGAALKAAADGITLGLAEIEALVRDALVRAGVATGTAEAVARRVGEAEARGMRAGGLAPLPDAIAALRAGRIDGTARPVLHGGGATDAIEVDGGHGLAAPAIEMGLPSLLEFSATGPAVLIATRVAGCGAVGSLAMSVAAAGRLALVRGPEGHEAAARPGLVADRPEDLSPAAADLTGLRARLAAWRPAPDWPTGPVGAPVDGMVMIVAAPARAGTEAGDRTQVPARRDRVSVPAALLAEIINA